MAAALAKQQRGFTLVELLVVLMIIGLAVAVASLSVGGSDNASRAEDEADFFLLSARFVSEQTVLNQEVLGLFWTPRAVTGTTQQQWCYRWQRFRDQVWEDTGDFLEERCLPEGIELEVRAEGDEWQYDPRQNPPRPVLVFYPSGEATPYEMAIIPDRFEEGETQRVEVSMMGDVVWLNRLSEEEQERWQ